MRNLFQVEGYALCTEETENVNAIEEETNSSRTEPWWSWSIFVKYGGAGFLIAIAYLDPGNLEADLQAGAYSKYQLLWVLFYAQFVGFILQNMATRLGVVTGKHLAQLCKDEYGPRTVKSLWICAELSIVACDVQAVITSAIALRILFGWPLWVGCVVTGVDALTFLTLDVLGVHSLEGFFVLLVGMMAMCFFWNFSVNPPRASEVLFGTFVPTMTSYGLKPAVGIIGSLIIPQNYFLHSAIVLQRPIDRSHPSKIREANKYLNADTLFALIVAFLINFTVVSCFAELFFNSECLPEGGEIASACLPLSGHTDDHYEESPILDFCSHDGTTGVCNRIGLSDAGLALSGALGGTASLAWALGLLASGQSSTMTITYAGQFIMEGFGGIKVPLYWRVVCCRLTALAPAVLAALSDSSAESTMDDVTQWANIMASICVPFSILPMLRFCNSSRLLGEHLMDRYSLALIWMVTTLLVFTNVYLIWTHMLDATTIPRPIAIPGLCALTIAYVYGVYALVDDEVASFCLFVKRKFISTNPVEVQLSAIPSKEEVLVDSVVPTSISVSTSGSSNIFVDDCNLTNISYDQDCEV